MMTVITKLVVTWILWELVSQFVSHPVDEDGPIRPPLSILDALWYNPGWLR
jgi:hypothetical protein